MKNRVKVKIIEGPVGISTNIDRYTPIMIDNIPNKPDTNAMDPGELEICLAVAAGIISIDVINNIPTTLTQVATKITNNVRKIDWIKNVFIFSAFATLSFIVINTSFSQIKKSIDITNIVDKTNQTTSLSVTVKISPNK